MWSEREIHLLSQVTLQAVKPLLEIQLVNESGDKMGERRRGRVTLQWCPWMLQVSINPSLTLYYPVFPFWFPLSSFKCLTVSCILCISVFQFFAEADVKYSSCFLWLHQNGDVLDILCIMWYIFPRIQLMIFGIFLKTLGSPLEFKI